MSKAGIRVKAVAPDRGDYKGDCWHPRVTEGPRHAAPRWISGSLRGSSGALTLVPALAFTAAGWWCERQAPGQDCGHAAWRCPTKVSSPLRAPGVSRCRPSGCLWEAAASTCIHHNTLQQAPANRRLHSSACCAPRISLAFSLPPSPAELVRLCREPAFLLEMVMEAVLVRTCA